MHVVTLHIDVVHGRYNIRMRVDGCRRQLGSGRQMRSSALQRRRRGLRSDSAKPGVAGHTFFSSTQHVEIPLTQMQAMQHVFQGTPTLQAARNVLHSRVLGQGLALQRAGVSVDMQPAFRRHVNEHWLPFANACLDSILMFGFVVVTSAELDVDEQCEGKQPSSKKANTYQIPIVPATGMYTLSFENTTPSSFVRTYSVRPVDAPVGTRDASCRVHVQQHPDAVGNVNSPMASVFDMSSFVDVLMNLAVTAEETRSHPPLITQMRRSANSAAIAASDMYFDTASEDACQQQQSRSNQRAALSLSSQVDLCAALNRSHAVGAHPQSLRASSRFGKTATAVADNSFTLPQDQEVATSTLPAARTDLVELLRTATDHMCAAMGVPSGLVFDSHYAAQSTVQLSLLNGTVSRISAALNAVLSRAYVDIYKDNDIELVTSPASVTTLSDIVALHTSGLADFEIAAPMALQAVGATSSMVEAALDRHRAAATAQSDQSAPPARMHNGLPTQQVATRHNKKRAGVPSIESAAGATDVDSAGAASKQRK